MEQNLKTFEHRCTVSAPVLGKDVATKARYYIIIAGIHKQEKHIPHKESKEARKRG